MNEATSVRDGKLANVDVSQGRSEARRTRPLLLADSPEVGESSKLTVDEAKIAQATPMPVGLQLQPVALQQNQSILS